jgi:L-lysine exporter family protein LysE/ArgO
MLSAFLTGFFLGISLIVAIGAQNAFVLRQGIIGQHVFNVALFCAVSDALLISLGVTGISFFLNNLVSEISNILFGLSAVWLSGYGILRLKAAFKSDITLEIETSSSKALLPTLSIVAVLTFVNPHVYLDTMILIGSVSQQFPGENILAYVLGASLASFVFFFSLAFGAKLLAPIMKRPFSWRILDCVIAFIMFVIAFKLASAGNWL